MNAKFLIFLFAAGAAGCMAVVLSSQYASGNVYTEYSSQRTDRMGTAALYEALARIGSEVSRNRIPLRTFDARNSEVLILGLEPSGLSAGYLDDLEALAKQGNRVVIGLDGASYIVNLKRINQPLSEGWHLNLVDKRTNRSEGFLPRDTFLFAPAAKSGWEAIGENAVRRAFGKGSILLIGTSWPFTNAALREDRDIAKLELAVGHPAHIVFDETHLGTVESGSVMALARRFRLQGVIAVALVCGLLFIWRSSAPFPPERAAAIGSDTRLAAASAGEGLRNLLAQHIPVDRVVSVCVAEWSKDRGRLAAPDTLAQMEAIAGRKTHPAVEWREIRDLLKNKRT